MISAVKRGEGLTCKLLRPSLVVAAPYFLGPTISKRYTTLRDATVSEGWWRFMGAQPAYLSLVVVNHRGKCSLLTSEMFQPLVVCGFDPLPRCHLDGGFLSPGQAFPYFV